MRDDRSSENRLTASRKGAVRLLNYSIVRENFHTDELGDYTSYGINVSGGGTAPFTVHDVFLNKHDAEHYVDLFNREQLEPVHLEQVIDEYLRELA